MKRNIGQKHITLICTSTLRQTVASPRSNVFGCDVKHVPCVFPHSDEPAGASAASPAASAAPAEPTVCHDDHERPAAPAEDETAAHPDGARAHSEETGGTHATGDTIPYISP